MILLIGATGTVGGEIAKQLVFGGMKARALVRNPEKAEGLKQIGVEVMEGNALDRASLSCALTGVEHVVLTTGAAADLPAVQKQIVEVALETGVKHAVKISALGASPNSPVRDGSIHGRAEADLKASGIDYTILRPAYFMQNFLEKIPDIMTGGKLELPLGEAKMSLVDVRDIAAVAVQALTEDGHSQKTYEITGPEALTGDEMADALGFAGGTRVRYVDANADEFHRTALSSGVPVWNAEGLKEMFGIFRKGYGAKLSRHVEQVMGRAPISFSQFARDHAEVLKAASPAAL